MMKKTTPQTYTVIKLSAQESDNVLAHQMKKEEQPVS